MGLWTACFYEVCRLGVLTNLILLTLNWLIRVEDGQNWTSRLKIRLKLCAFLHTKELWLKINFSIAFKIQSLSLKKLKTASYVESPIYHFALRVVFFIEKWNKLQLMSILSALILTLNTNVYSCLPVIFQFQLVSLQLSRLSNERPIRITLNGGPPLNSVYA